jgi:hypothetical protein
MEWFEHPSRGRTEEGWLVEAEGSSSAICPDGGVTSTSITALGGLRSGAHGRHRRGIGQMQRGD